MKKLNIHYSYGPARDAVWTIEPVPFVKALYTLRWHATGIPMNRKMINSVSARRTAPVRPQAEYDDEVVNGRGRIWPLPDPTIFDTIARQRGTQ